MVKKSLVKKREDRGLARQKIVELFTLSKNLRNSPDLAKRYVFLIRRLSNKFKIKLTADQRRSFCRKCNSFYFFPSNASVRYRDGTKVITCFSCKNISRIPYK